MHLSTLLPMLSVRRPSFSQRVSLFLDRVLPSQPVVTEGHWVVNQAKHQSFRAKVFRFDDGTWSYDIVVRTGWHTADYVYSWPPIEEEGFRSRRAARRAGTQMARQLAALRYRFN